MGGCPGPGSCGMWGCWSQGNSLLPPWGPGVVATGQQDQAPDISCRKGDPMAVAILEYCTLCLKGLNLSTL